MTPQSGMRPQVSYGGGPPPGPAGGLTNHVVDAIRAERAAYFQYLADRQAGRKARPPKLQYTQAWPEQTRPGG